MSGRYLVLKLTDQEATALWHLLYNEPVVQGGRESPDGTNSALSRVFKKLEKEQAR